jgi:hypothetical protein
MPRIVVYAHRPKRPAPKKEPKAAVAVTQAVVVVPNEKRARLLRAERWAAKPREPSPEADAFFARNVRPGGPLPPRGVWSPSPKR